MYEIYKLYERLQLIRNNHLNLAYANATSLELNFMKNMKLLCLTALMSATVIMTGCATTTSEQKAAMGVLGGAAGTIVGQKLGGSTGAALGGAIGTSVATGKVDGATIGSGVGAAVGNKMGGSTGAVIGSAVGTIAGSAAESQMKK